MSKAVTTRPPWWRPFARRRYDHARNDELIVAVEERDPSDWMRAKLKRRSQQLRNKLNAETDQEALEADLLNGIPMFTVQRALRNREGEQ